MKPSDFLFYQILNFSILKVFVKYLFLVSKYYTVVWKTLLSYLCEFDLFGKMQINNFLSHV